MRETLGSRVGLTRVKITVAAQYPACREGTSLRLRRRKKMLAAVSLISLIVGLVALAWAQGRASESLLATDPALMAAAAAR
jgi:hypothetical protein